MNIEELKKKLQEENIPDNWYSINGSIEVDTFFLNHNYDYWECFYVDERGNQNNDYRRFTSEDEACKYLFQQLMIQKQDLL